MILLTKKLNPVASEFFIKGRKLNISLVLIRKFYFPLPKNIRLNSTHYFFMTIPNKQKFTQNKYNDSADVSFEDCLYLYKKCTASIKRLAIKNYKTILTDKQLKYLHSRLEKLINMNILEVNKCYFLIKEQ